MSPDSPQDPPRPGRLIVPGGESEPPAEKPRLVVPDSAREEEAPPRPRIVLPSDNSRFRP